MRSLVQRTNNVLQQVTSSIVPSMTPKRVDLAAP